MILVYKDYKNIKEKYVNVHVIYRNEFKAYIRRIGIYVPSMPTALMAPKLKFCILIEQWLRQQIIKWRLWNTMPKNECKY